MVHPIRLASVLAFLAFPILEIGLLIRAGQILGFWKLALLVIATAILGSIVIKRTGFAVISKARQELDSGGRGFNPLLDGLLQITAGLLLIFPGLISDVLGLTLLIPAIRNVLVTHVLPRFFAVTTFTSQDDHFGPKNQQEPRHGTSQGFDGSMDGGVTIEGEYERVSERDVAENRTVAARPLRRSAK